MTGSNIKIESFVSAIKNSRIKQPTQIGFSEEGWKGFFDSFENISEADKQLFESGIWFFRYFNEIRSELSKFNDKVIDLDVLRRAYVAIINRDYIVADSALKEHLEENKESGITVGAISEKKLPIGPNDFEVHVFAVIQAGLNAVRFPLSETFAKNKNISKKKISDAEILRILQIRINLDSLYNTLSDFWGECLWNQWNIQPKENVDLVVPPKSKKHLSRVISEHRYESLNAEFSYHTFNIWSNLPIIVKEHERNKKRIVSIDKKGKRKIFRLGKYDDENELLPSLSMAIATEELYWDKLLLTPLPHFPNITIRDMMHAWELLASFGRTLKSKMPTDTGVTGLKKLLQFAPKFKMNELINSLKKATGLSHEKIISMIKLCVFSGDLRQDPWIKPIIPLADNSFCAFIPSLIVTNRIRLIESWMREGGTNLDERGYAFEDHVRKEIKKYIKSSKHLSKTIFSSKLVRLSEAGQEEEIDFVWVIGSLVLIGEVKCSLFPTSPIEFHNFFDLIDSAVLQAKRKANFVQNNLFALFQTLNIEIPENEEHLKVFPIVITNLPYGSGFPVNEVPITDLRILIRYIKGHQNFFISTASNGDDKATKMVFYNSVEEAEDNIINFLKSPPTIKLFMKMLDREVMPLPRFENQKKNAGWVRLYVNESLFNQG